MISFLPQEKDGSVVFTAFDGDEALGSCEFTLSGYNMTFTRMDCGDDIITEGLARSAMGCAANRGGYIAKISSSLSSPAFERLGFAGGDILSDEIPQALTSGCTCHQKKTEM